MNATDSNDYQGRHRANGADAIWKGRRLDRDASRGYLRYVGKHRPERAA